MLKVFKNLDDAKKFAFENADLLGELKDVPFWGNSVLSEVEPHICLIGETTRDRVEALMEEMPIDRCAREIPDEYRPTPWFTCFILFGDEDEVEKNADPEELDSAPLPLSGFFSSKQADDYYGVVIDDDLADARAQVEWKANHPDTGWSMEDCDDADDAVIIGIDEP